MRIKSRAIEVAIVLFPTVDLEILLLQVSLGAEGARVGQQLGQSVSCRLVPQHQQVLLVNFAAEVASGARFLHVDQRDVSLQRFLVVVGMVAELTPELFGSVPAVAVLWLWALSIFFPASQMLINVLGTVGAKGAIGTLELLRLGLQKTMSTVNSTFLGSLSTFLGYPKGYVYVISCKLLSNGIPKNFVPRNSSGFLLSEYIFS